MICFHILTFACVRSSGQMHELVANSSSVQQVVAARVVSSALGQALESSAGRHIAPLVRASFVAPLERFISSSADAEADAGAGTSAGAGVGVDEGTARDAEVSVSEKSLSACLDLLHALCVRCATATLPSGTLIECLLRRPLLALFALLRFTARSASLIRYFSK